uniref:uncharacterized protein LOC101298677 isoform X2 n=1 Tax=Fragaria vesca subsp. vesca TaxID=101020 RepID=UPI0005C8D4C9|nr:PREDICTED: uncharacterized protein LOC101298677 isoform X2 [Fragaria vesca subsp. vesca]
MALLACPPCSCVGSRLLQQKRPVVCFSNPRKFLVKCVSQKKQVELERLFSNLNQTTLKREPGSLSSAVFLVAGTTVGAGILAIPAVTQESGFLATAITCVFCWAYMVATGLLIAEVNINTMSQLGSTSVSLVSMAMRTLGDVGVQIVWSCTESMSVIEKAKNRERNELEYPSKNSKMKHEPSKISWTYIFIHYALLVAYVARSSEIWTKFVGIPLWESATLFSLVLGGICYFGSQRFIGAVNGVLVTGIIISFAALVAVASGYLQWSALLKANFQAVPMSIPIIILSFVYQNVVPVLCTDLEGDLSKVRTSIVLGTTIPLILFLVWDAVILGTISHVEMGSGKIMDPLQLLESTNVAVGPVEVFSIFAISTSYIGFVLGLCDFLSDLLKLPAGQSRPVLPYLFTLIPPVVLSLLDPEIFFKALDFAGTYGVLLLFGILPAVMSWSDRYSSSSIAVKVPRLVPGGRFTLSLIVAGAGCVIFSEIFDKLSNQ